MRRVKQISCRNCGKEVARKPNVYCSGTCQHEWEYKQYIVRWKAGNEKGWTSKTVVLSGYVEKYIQDKYNNKCSICSWCEVNPFSNKVPLEIHHIDGDAKNCKEENLTLLCPNHHSLTSTFRNLNKSKSNRNRKP